MHIIARTLTVLGVLLIPIVFIPVSAYASPGDYVNCEQNPTAPACVVNPRTPAAPGGNDGGRGGGSAECRDGQGRVVPCYIPGKGWFGGDSCWYQPATGTELGAAEALGGKAKPPARWYVGSCGDPLSNFWPPGYVRFRMFGPDGVDVEALADEALSRLQLPRPGIRINPEPPTAQVVFVPSWLWVDAGTWGSRSASASAGGLTVTATAKAKQVVWSTGDGSSVTCMGPGTPWRSGTDPAKASPTCGHTYTRPSAGGGSFTVRATVTWEISWAGGGQSGNRPALTTTAAMDVRVLEAGAVNTNGVS